MVFKRFILLHKIGVWASCWQTQAAASPKCTMSSHFSTHASLPILIVKTYNDALI